MFTSGVVQYLTMLFSKSKQMLDINFVGTNFSVFQVLMGVLITCFVISIAHKLINLSVGVSSSGFAQRGSATNNVRISNNRKGDEF